MKSYHAIEFLLTVLLERPAALRLIDSDRDDDLERWPAPMRNSRKARHPVGGFDSLINIVI